MLSIFWKDGLYNICLKTLDTFRKLDISDCILEAMYIDNCDLSNDSVED